MLAEPVVLDISHRIFALREFLETSWEALGKEKSRQFEEAESFHGSEEDYAALLSELDWKWGDGPLSGIESYSSMEHSLSYAGVVLCWTVLEASMRALAGYLHKKRGGAGIAPSDLRGSAVDQAKLYLAKKYGIELGKSRAWDRIRDLEKMRHIVAHAAGLLSDESKIQTIRELAAKYEGEVVDVQDYGSFHGSRVIAVRLPFVRASVDALKQLFDELFAQLELQTETKVFSDS